MRKGMKSSSVQIFGVLSLLTAQFYIEQCNPLPTTTAYYPNYPQPAQLQSAVKEMKTRGDYPPPNPAIRPLQGILLEHRQRVKNANGNAPSVYEQGKTPGEHPLNSAIRPLQGILFEHHKRINNGNGDVKPLHEHITVKDQQIHSPHTQRKTSGPQTSKKLIYAGHLLDLDRGLWRQQASIMIEDNNITQISDEFIPAPSDVEIIDLRSKYVLPGLIDLHVHLETVLDPGMKIRQISDDPADTAFSAGEYAKQTVMAGFTTVRDAGGSGVNIALKNAVNKGTIIGPRIFTSRQPISITGGHGDDSNGFSAIIQHMMKTTEEHENICDSPDSCRRAVRHQLKMGADFIKVMATAGVLSGTGRGAAFTMDELYTIVQTAADSGVHVAAHAHGKEGIMRALNAGVRTIEHCTFMDKDTFQLFRQNSIYCVPTLMAAHTVEMQAEDPKSFLPMEIRKAALDIAPRATENFKESLAGGVGIAFGTDAGIFQHGDNAKEFELLVKHGMSPIEAIKSATIIAARVLNLEDMIGSIEVGKEADIIAVDEDPLKNITQLQTVRFVMKQGEVLKPFQQHIKRLYRPHNEF